MAAKSGTLRWGIIFLCMILGTWAGFYCQRIPAVSGVFKNVVDFSFDINQIDIVMARFGFFFALKLNLGTLLGALLGIWAARK